MQEWQRHQQQQQVTILWIYMHHRNERPEFIFYERQCERKIWLLSLLNRFIYRFQSYYFKIVLPCLWHDIDIAEVTSERHIKCDTITIIKFIYFGWVSDKTHTHTHTRTHAQTHYTTSLSLFRSAHQFDDDGWCTEEFPITHIPEHLSFRSIGFPDSLRQSLTHVLYRTLASASVAPIDFICFLLKIHNEMSLTSAIIGSKSIRERHRARAVVQKDGIWRVAMQIKHLYGKNFTIMKMCQIQAPLLARLRTITTIEWYEQKSNNDRKTTRIWKKTSTTTSLLESMFERLAQEKKPRRSGGREARWDREINTRR